MTTRPREVPLTRRSPRVAAAARLRRRRRRDAAGLFLAEGPQAVREALARPAAVRRVFGTSTASDRYADLTAAATAAGIPVDLVTDDAAAALSETVTPQGLVAVCAQPDVPLAEALGGRPVLVAVLVDIGEPGNAGSVLRTADAAGAGTVVFAGAAVDPYNGKCVRATAGSIFHLPVARVPQAAGVVPALRSAGLQVLAATGAGDADLETLADEQLARPTAWLFGSEAHGLPPALAAAADAEVRVPIHGRAESLNLGAAAAVCLYTSARAQRRSGLRPPEPGAREADR